MMADMAVEKLENWLHCVEISLGANSLKDISALLRDFADHLERGGRLAAWFEGMDSACDFDVRHKQRQPVQGCGGVGGQYANPYVFQNVQPKTKDAV